MTLLCVSELTVTVHTVSLEAFLTGAGVRAVGICAVCVITAGKVQILSYKSIFLHLHDNIINWQVSPTLLWSFWWQIERHMWNIKQDITVKNSNFFGKRFPVWENLGKISQIFPDFPHYFPWYAILVLLWQVSFLQVSQLFPKWEFLHKMGYISQNEKIWEYSGKLDSLF